jgi:hypothetical protein
MAPNQTNSEQMYSAGDDVFVIDPAFEPVVQRGTVGIRDSDTRGPEITVEFGTDPFDADSDDPRDIDVLAEQMLHSDADERELYTTMGMADLLE